MTVPVITGGSSGIGVALCRRLVPPGALLLVRAEGRREGMEAWAAELAKPGAGTCVAVKSFADPSRAGAEVEAALGAAGAGRNT